MVAGPGASSGCVSRVTVRETRIRVSVSCVIAASSGSDKENSGTVTPPCSITAVTSMSTPSVASIEASNRAVRPMKRVGWRISIAGPVTRPAPT